MATDAVSRPSGTGGLGQKNLEAREFPGTESKILGMKAESAVEVGNEARRGEGIEQRAQAPAVCGVAFTGRRRLGQLVPGQEHIIGRAAVVPRCIGRKAQ